MKEIKDNKFMQTKKAILEALEDKPKFELGNLVGGFLAIMIANTCLEFTTNSLKEKKLI